MSVGPLSRPYSFEGSFGQDLLMVTPLRISNKSGALRGTRLSSFEPSSSTPAGKYTSSSDIKFGGTRWMEETPRTTFSSVRSKARKVSPGSFWSDENTLVDSPRFSPSHLSAGGKFRRDDGFREPLKLIQQSKLKVNTASRANLTNDNDSHEENTCSGISLDDADPKVSLVMFQDHKEKRSPLVDVPLEAIMNLCNVSSRPDIITTPVHDRPEFHMRLTSAPEEDLLEKQPPRLSWLLSSVDALPSTATQVRGQEELGANLALSVEESTSACNSNPLSGASTHRTMSSGSEGHLSRTSEASRTLHRRPHVNDLRKAYKYTQDSPKTSRLLPQPEVGKSHATAFEYQLTVSMLASLHDKPQNTRPLGSEIPRKPLRKAFRHLLKGIVSF